MYELTTVKPYLKGKYQNKLSMKQTDICDYLMYFTAITRYLK